MLSFSVERLGALFPQLGLQSDNLREELVDYQVTDRRELPEGERVDRFWGLLGKDERFAIDFKLY